MHLREYKRKCMMVLTLFPLLLDLTSFFPVLSLFICVDVDVDAKHHAFVSSYFSSPFVSPFTIALPSPRSSPFSDHSSFFPLSLLYICVDVDADAERSFHCSAVVLALTQMQSIILFLLSFCLTSYHCSPSSSFSPCKKL